jgi:hypothetical protein
MLLQQQRIVGGIIPYAVHVTSKESRQFFPELLVFSAPIIML